MNGRVIAGVVSVLAIAALVYIATLQVERSPVGFYGEGKLVKDTPGLEKGVWYMLYDEPGFPGLSVPLLFNDLSVCGIESNLTVCDMSFLQGDHVRVEGTRKGERVTVEKLVYVNPNSRSIPIRLYYYNAAKDLDAKGNVKCSSQGLEYVERVLPFTKSPLTDSIKLLLQGDISEAEKARGISSEFPLFAFRLVSAALQKGIATLTFSDPNKKTNGGACRANILWAQIEATAKQFPAVQSVQFLPMDMFQP